MGGYEASVGGGGSAGGGPLAVSEGKPSAAKTAVFRGGGGGGKCPETATSLSRISEKGSLLQMGDVGGGNLALATGIAGHWAGRVRW